jgi:hypothetical protein
MGLGEGQGADPCECGYEPLGSMKCGKFIDLTDDLLGSYEKLCSMELVS